MPVIRPATPHDLEPVEAVVRAAYSGYIARIGREPGPMLDDYASLIGKGLVHVVDDGEVVAVLVLVPEPGAMLLDNVAVHPAAQGKGYGRLLLAFAEEEAQRQGLGAIRLYTHVLMTENIALYTRLGYVETHRGEERGFARVYMAKRLMADP
jgi:ribosomal protein S18 acetylase RimI-like enzyme